MADQELKNFKSQPWFLFDTIVSSDFTCGSATNAIGQTTPAISLNGELVFFQSAGRLSAQMPWWTNLDQVGTLAYGFEVWALYFSLLMPKVGAYMSFGQQAVPDGMGPTSVDILAAALLQFGVCEVTLGQENQMTWPLSRFGSGGGFWTTSPVVSNPQSGMPEVQNVLALPEPIEMPRTQNVNAKIRLANEAISVIGRPTALGAGAPLDPLSYTDLAGNTVVTTAQPYAVQFGFIGRRIKDTQYGQIPG